MNNECQECYQIEFRFWDGKTMLDSTYVDSSIGLLDALSGRTNLVAMKFTNLHDKNGKPIYESDIVRIKHPLDKGGDFGNTIGEVWQQEDGQWVHGNTSGRPPKSMFKYCEIIGNIYENPELLK